MLIEALHYPMPISMDLPIKVPLSVTIQIVPHNLQTPSIIGCRQLQSCSPPSISHLARLCSTAMDTNCCKFPRLQVLRNPDISMSIGGSSAPRLVLPFDSS